MSQIKLTTLKQGTPSKNILSCSFFTMKDSYKNFSRYESYLLNFLKYQKILNHFETRIYVDKTSKDFALNASKTYPNVSIIEFKCPEFEDDFSHIGTFGAFPRFLPLFEPNLEIVWITDIDITSNYLNNNIVKYIKHNNIDLNIITTVCFAFRGMQNKYPLMAGNLIFNKFKANKRILTSFFNRVLKGDENDIIEKLNSLNKSKPPSKIPYGMDEYFLNHYFYNILKRMQLKCLVSVDYAHDTILQKYTDKPNIIKEYYNNPSKYNFKKYKEVIEDAINKAIIKYPCYNETLKLMDNFKESFTTNYIVYSSDF